MGGQRAYDGGDAAKHGGSLERGVGIRRGVLLHSQKSAGAHSTADGRVEHNLENGDLKVAEAALLTDTRDLAPSWCRWMSKAVMRSPPLPLMTVAELLEATGRWALLLRPANRLMASHVTTGADPADVAREVLRTLRINGSAAVDTSAPYEPLDLNDPARRVLTSYLLHNRPEARLVRREVWTYWAEVFYSCRCTVTVVDVTRQRGSHRLLLFPSCCPRSA